MIKRILIQCFLIGMVFTMCAQSPAKYWVHFKDKANSPYSISRPEEFLSPLAITLRTQHHIAIEENDLPVNPQYIKQVLALDPSMRLFTQSKWLNGITVYSTDSTILESIIKLPCVAFAERTTKMKTPEPALQRAYTYSASGPATYTYQSDITHDQDFDYGKSNEQIRLNNAQWLHRMGFRGEHVRMMVMDGGFINVDTLRYFNNLRADNRLIGARNLVQPEESPFKRHTHGTMVLSCIASYVPGELVGTAPMVEVFVCQTEDSRSETKIEEDNWAAGLELADSLGCQVLNSSLGYTKFDDTTQVRNYQDMNGQVSRAAQAATIAASKGMIICNSAGNEGGKPWNHIGAPADAKDILSVGAVNIFGERAPFSSYGPTSDGRIKPDACAVGWDTYVGNQRSKTIRSNGTSFSSPVLSGMVVCLREAFPDKSNYEIMQAIRESGNYFSHPDSAFGYGIPDFLRAYNILLQPQSSELQLHFTSFVAQKGEITATVHPTKPMEITVTSTLRNRKKPVLQSFTITNNQLITLKMPKLPSKTTYGIVDITVKETNGSALHYVVGIENTPTL